MTSLRFAYTDSLEDPSKRLEAPPRFIRIEEVDRGDHDPVQAREANISYFGTYSVNEVDHTFALHIVGSSFANWNGTDQVRPFEIAGNQLKITKDRAGA